MSKQFYPRRTTELWLYNRVNKTTIIYSDKDLQLYDFCLNDVGSFIWQHCDGMLSNYDIARKLYNELVGEKPEFTEIQSDIKDFLNEFRSNGLVEWTINCDVLFVIPPFPAVYTKSSIKNPDYSSPPLGVAYIAAVLKENNIDVAILDMHIKALNPEDIITYCREKAPKIVALSATTPTFPNAVRIAKLLKAWDETVIIVIGGAHVTCLPEECIEFDCFDYVVVGEGEFTMLELTNSLIFQTIDLSTINGLVYKRNGVVIAKKERKQLDNLDFLPYPARELLDINEYYQKGSIISSRGCPYHCNYCSCSVISGNTYRVHSIDYVLKEIEYLMSNYKIEYFDFHDDNFNFYPERVWELCKEIKKRKMKIHWSCFCRVSNFNEEIAFVMKDAGCVAIQFGIEAGNQTVLNSIKKRINLAEIEIAVTSARKADINRICCGFIIGHAEDTEHTIEETIDFGIKLATLGATDLTISLLTPLPGTEIYNNLGKNGIILLTKDWEQFIFSKVVIETKNVTKERLRELYVKGINLFCNKK